MLARPSSSPANHPSSWDTTGGWQGVRMVFRRLMEILERVIVYLSTDRPGLVFVSDFEGGRKRAMMEGVREAFDAAIATMAGDPPLVSEGLSIYLRVPPSDVPDAIMRIANASAEALRSALARHEDTRSDPHSTP